MKFTDEEGKVWQSNATGPLDRGVGRCWVHLSPIPTIHEFGGVRFEETGEVRPVNSGEWCLEEGRPYYVNGYNKHDYIILRPLQGEK